MVRWKWKIKMLGNCTSTYWVWEAVSKHFCKYLMSRRSQSHQLIFPRCDEISDVSDLKLRERLMLINKPAKITTKESAAMIFATPLWFQTAYCTTTDITVDQRHTHSLTHADVTKTSVALGTVHWFTCQMTFKKKNHHDLTSEGAILALCVLSWASEIIIIGYFVTAIFNKHQLV